MSAIEATGDSVPGWSRMPNESQKALEAAREYFKMGASRSLQKVSRMLGKHVSLLEQWSARWGWVGRAVAYDDHLAKQEQIEIEKQANARGKERRRRADEQSELLYRLKQKILRKVDKMLDVPLMSITQADGKTMLKPARWGLGDAAPLVDIVLKIDKASNREGGDEDNLVAEEFVTDDYK
jgi:hypothetical protein